MNDGNKKVKCLYCKRKVRKRNLRETKDGRIICRQCKTAKHRLELKATLESLPRLKCGSKPNNKILFPLLKPGEIGHIRKKRYAPLRSPIRKIEKEVLRQDLKKEGLSDKEIKERIEKLEQTVKLNHVKEFYLLS